MTNKIGIFSGTFDPIHVGHIEVALSAQMSIGLDNVLFMIEKSPHRKERIANYEDRLKMLKIAVEHHDKFEVVESKKPNITTDATLKMIHKRYPDHKPVIIIGSDMLKHMGEWEGVDQLLKEAEVCVILRSNEQKAEMLSQTTKLKKKYPNSSFQILPPILPRYSSSNAKKDLKNIGHSDILHKDVQAYILKNKIYDSSRPK